MAAVLGAAPGTVTLNQDFLDIFSQPFIRRTDLDGTISDVDVTAIVNNIDLVSNAKIAKANINAKRVFTGQKAAAINALQNLNSIVLVLTFRATKADGKKATRTFLIPAPKENTISDGGSVDIVTNTALAALIPLLEDNLQWIDSDETVQSGGMTYDPTASAFATLEDVVEIP